MTDPQAPTPESKIQNPKSKISGMMWGGRMKGKLDRRALEFSSSIALDIRLLPYDVLASIAWAEAIRKAGILSAGELRRMKGALRLIAREPIPSPAELAVYEDVHSFRSEERRVGKEGRSR